MNTATSPRVGNQVVEYAAAVIFGCLGGAALAFMSVGMFVLIASMLGIAFLLLRATAVSRLRLLAAYLATAGLGFFLIVVGFWS